MLAQDMHGILTKKTMMKAATYATAIVWSLDPSNGAELVMLIITAVAAYRQGIIRIPSELRNNMILRTDVTDIAPSSCNKDTIPKPMRYPEDLLYEPGQDNPEGFI